MKREEIGNGVVADGITFEDEFKRITGKDWNDVDKSKYQVEYESVSDNDGISESLYNNFSLYEVTLEPEDKSNNKEFYEKKEQIGDGVVADGITFADEFKRITGKDWNEVNQSEYYVEYESVTDNDGISESLYNPFVLYKIERFPVQEFEKKISDLEEKLRESAERMQEYKDNGFYDKEADEHEEYNKLVDEINKLKAEKETFKKVVIDDKEANVDNELEKYKKQEVDIESQIKEIKEKISAKHKEISNIQYGTDKALETVKLSDGSEVKMPVVLRLYRELDDLEDSLNKLEKSKAEIEKAINEITGEYIENINDEPEVAKPEVNEKNQEAEENDAKESDVKETEELEAEEVNEPEADEVEEEPEVEEVDVDEPETEEIDEPETDEIKEESEPEEVNEPEADEVAEKSEVEEVNETPTEEVDAGEPETDENNEVKADEVDFGEPEIEKVNETEKNNEEEQEESEVNESVVKYNDKKFLKSVKGFMKKVGEFFKKAFGKIKKIFTRGTSSSRNLRKFDANEERISNEKDEQVENKEKLNDIKESFSEKYRVNIENYPTPQTEPIENDDELGLNQKKDEEEER